MTRIKIFSRGIDNLPVLEKELNDFSEKFNIIEMHTNTAKDKYGTDSLIVTVAYEDFVEDEEELEEEAKDLE
jgi:hypothetical protein